MQNSDVRHPIHQLWHQHFQQRPSRVLRHHALLSRSACSAVIDGVHAPDSGMQNRCRTGRTTDRNFVCSGPRGGA